MTVKKSAPLLQAVIMPFLNVVYVPDVELSGCKIGDLKIVNLNPAVSVRAEIRATKYTLTIRLKKTTFGKRKRLT